MTMYTTQGHGQSVHENRRRGRSRHRHWERKPQNNTCHLCRQHGQWKRECPTSQSSIREGASDWQWLGIVGKGWTPTDEPNQLVRSEPHTHTENIEKDTTALTYVQYTSDSFKKFSQHTLTISEQNVVFLVDSGATQSVIKDLELTTKPKLSGNYMYSVGSSGQTIRENITIPLKCEDGLNTWVEI